MKCGYTRAVSGLIPNDMQIAVEAVSARCCALPADALKSGIWQWPTDPRGVGWWLPVHREAASPGSPFLRVWAVLAMEMSYLRVKVDPSWGNILLGVVT